MVIAYGLNLKASPTGRFIKPASYVYYISISTIDGNHDIIAKTLLPTDDNARELPFTYLLVV